jgi:hypothetical protein
MRIDNIALCPMEILQDPVFSVVVDQGSSSLIDKIMLVILHFIRLDQGYKKGKEIILPRRTGPNELGPYPVGRRGVAQVVHQSRRLNPQPWEVCKNKNKCGPRQGGSICCTTKVCEKKVHAAVLSKSQGKRVRTYLSAILLTIVSVGISRLITISTWTTSSKCSACPTVRGKPSSNSDLPSSRLGVASFMTKPIINSSGTSFPASM